jgi:hypothetical protein
LKRIQAPVLLVAAILAVNVYLCWGLFSIEYLAHMGSVEGSFIGLARYFTLHWRDLSWFPLWHLGMPYVNAYPPLLHTSVAVTSMLTKMSVPHAFHWVTALLYCLGPVTLFALALRLTKSHWVAFAAAALYSVISWSSWLIPGIAADLGSHFHPRRLQALVGYGESPHIASMTFLPFALLLWDISIERRRAAYLFLASIAIAATVLTSWLGGFALALMILADLFSRHAKRRDLGWMGLTAASAGLLALPWMPPFTIAATAFNSRTLGGDFSRTYETLPMWLLLMVALLAAFRFALHPVSRDLRFALIFLLLIASVVFPFTLYGISVVPQPVRYHLELEMAISLLVPIAVKSFLSNRAAGIALVVLCIALILPIRTSRRYARNLIRPVDIANTTEYKVAQWLNREWHGGRVMMSGSVAFWLTAFGDVPELNGGTEQGAVDYMARVAAYGIYYGEPAAAGRNGEYAVLWLKALGVQAVGVTFPESGEFYHPYANPRQFEGLLQPIYSDHGDVIYRVSDWSSLAHVVPRTSQVTQTPKNGIDVDPLRAYVAALDHPSLPADFRWTSLHSARISAQTDPGDFISVQIPWHQGWHAALNGQPTRLFADAIGLMCVFPRGDGPQEVELTYDGGRELQAARIVSGVWAALLAIACIVSFLKK